MGMIQTIYVENIPFEIEIKEFRTAIFRGGQFSSICYLKLHDDNATYEVSYSSPYIESDNFDKIKNQLLDKIIDILKV
jgi:hypothetical protein